MKDLEEWTNRIHLNKNVASILFTIANLIYCKNQKLLLIYIAYFSFFLNLVKHNFNLRPFGEGGGLVRLRAGQFGQRIARKGFL